MRNKGLVLASTHPKNLGITFFDLFCLPFREKKKLTDMLAKEIVIACNNAHSLAFSVLLFSTHVHTNSHSFASIWKRADFWR